VRYFVANFIYAFQQCKHFENRLRFDKVVESLKVETFCETQCKLIYCKAFGLRSFCVWIQVVSVSQRGWGRVHWNGDYNQCVWVVGGMCWGLYRVAVKSDSSLESSKSSRERKINDSTLCLTLVYCKMWDVIQQRVCRLMLTNKVAFMNT